MQVYGQTIVEGGAVIQVTTAHIGDDTTQHQRSFVLFKQQSLEIISIMNNCPQVVYRIRFNQANSQCIIIPADYVCYKTDLMLLVSVNMDVRIIQFSGPIAQLRHKIVQQFNLIEHLQNDSQFQLPFLKKASPISCCFPVNTSVRCVVLTYQETSLMLTQVCFMAINLDGLAVNIGMAGKYPQNLNIHSLVSQICQHKALNKQYKGTPMLPVLGIFTMYSNKYTLFDVGYTDFFKKFGEYSQVQFCEDGVVLSEGPYLVTNIADFSQVYSFTIEDQKEEILFPLLMVSITKVQILYNFDRVVSIDIHDQSNVHLAPMARPLSVAHIGSESMCRFVASYDDGNLLLIEFNPSNASLQIQSLQYQTDEHSNYATRMTTCTSIVSLAYQATGSTHFDQYLFLGSQSVDSNIARLSDDNKLIGIRRKVSRCIGAVQDFSVYMGKRMLISTSHGRDGSISNAYFGFQCDVSIQIPIRQSLYPKQREPALDTRVINSYIEGYQDSNGQNQWQQIIIVSQEQRSDIYRLRINSCTNDHMLEKITDEEPYCQLYSNLSFLLVAKIFNEKCLLKVTSSYIQIDNREKYMYEIVAVQILDDQIFILDTNGCIQLLQINERTYKITKLYQHQEEHGQILAFTLLQNSGKQYVVLATNSQEIKMYQVADDRLTLVHEHILQFGVTSIAASVSGQTGQLVLVASGARDVFCIETTTRFTELSIRRSLPCEAASVCYSYQNNLFIQSHNSLYRLVRLNEQVFVQPLLTQPLSNILAAAPMQLLEARLKCDQPVHLNLFRISQVHAMADNYLPFSFALITDEMVDTHLQAAEYPVAYRSEKERDGLCTTTDYLLIARSCLTPRYSYKRQLIKRTPVKVCSLEEHHVLAVLTEQYVGKIQIRFFVDSHYHQIEFAKIIPSHSICTDMKFIALGTQIYLAIALISVVDIYEELCRDSNQFIPQKGDADEVVHSLNTRLEIYQAFPNQMKVDLRYTMKFEQQAPINSFIQTKTDIICVIGNQIVALYNQLPLQIKFQKEFDTELENLLEIGDYFYASKSGQIIKLNKQFSIVKEQKKFTDVKILTRFTKESLFAYAYDHKCGVLDLDLNLQCQITVYQSVTCARENQGKIYLGTDTGAILIFKQEDISFLKFLEQEIVSWFENQGRPLCQTEALNAVDGDVVTMFLDMTVAAQESIARKLNQTRQWIMDKLLYLQMKVAD